MYGIDISRYQKGLNLATINPGFVIIKATESTNWTDPECNVFYQQAKSLGIPRGVYHFARNGTNKGTAGAIAEADYFLSQVKGYIGDGILVLDWEDPNGNKAEVTWAKAWLDRVYERTGVRPLIYMSSSVVNAADWSSVAKDYGLWVANYGANNGKQNAKPSVKWWSFYAMWQYTSVNGRYPQWAGNLDCNEFYGDVSAWNKYAGVSGKQADNDDESSNNENENNQGKENMTGIEMANLFLQKIGKGGNDADWSKYSEEQVLALANEWNARGETASQLDITKARLATCKMDLSALTGSNQPDSSSAITQTKNFAGKVMNLKRVRMDTATTNLVAEYE